MTQDQQELLEAARESIAAARVLLDSGFARFAAPRAYFAMFYVAEAFLEGEGMAFSKHSAVISAFGQHFAKTGKVPAEFHKYLLEAQELRHKGDYDVSGSVTSDQAQEQIARAKQFLELAEKLIGPIPHINP